MLRAALATAGAHEATLPGTVQALLHPQGVAVLIRPTGYGRLYLGSLPSVRAGGLGRVASALALSAQAPRTLAGYRCHQDGHQLLQDKSESPRQRLQHRIP